MAAPDENPNRLRLLSPYYLPAEILFLGYPKRQRAQAAEKSRNEVVFYR